MEDSLHFHSGLSHALSEEEISEAQMPLHIPRFYLVGWVLL